jgi:hypothetical protein
MSCGNPIAKAYDNVKQKATQAYQTLETPVSAAVTDIGQAAANTIDYIMAHPLPIIEAVAISYVLGPAGAEASTATDAGVAAGGAGAAAGTAAGAASAGTAIIEDTALRAAITNAAVTAINGGDINKMILSIGSGYAGSLIGQYVGSAAGNVASGGSYTAPATYEDPVTGAVTTQSGITTATQQLVKQVVTSASGQAATAALQGQPINQIMYSAVAGAASGAVANELKAAGYTNVPTSYIANATQAATKAILNGQDVGTAIQTSAKATAIAQAVAIGTDQLNQLKTEAENYYNNTFVPAAQAAQTYFTTNVDPLQTQYAALQTSTQSNVTSFNNDLAAYNADVATYNADPGSSPKTADQINSEGTALANRAPDIQSQITSLNNLGTQLTSSQATYQPLSDAANAAQNQFNTYYNDLNTQAASVAASTVDYQQYVTQDATGITDQLASTSVQDAEQTLNSVSQAQGWKDYPTQQAAASVGFSDPTVYATAQQYNIPTMDQWTQVNAESQKSGWSGYAQEQSANTAGFTDPTTYDTAQKYGIPTAAAWTQVNAESQAAGWSGYAQEQTANSAGFTEPSELAMAYTQIVDAFSNPTGTSEPAINEPDQNPENPLIPAEDVNALGQIKFDINKIYGNLPTSGANPLLPTSTGSSSNAPATGTSTANTNTSATGLTSEQLAILATPTIFTPDAPVVDTGAPKVNLAGLVYQPTNVVQNTTQETMADMPTMTDLATDYGAPQDVQRVIYASPNEGETTTMAATGGSVDDLLQIMNWRV